MSVVRFEQDDALGRIVLASPPFNFVGEQFNKDLITAVHNAGESEIRALLISSEGPNFSVGGAVHEWRGKSYQWFRTFVAEVANSYRALEALRIPVVAAIRGQTSGGGFELALSADFIVASLNTVLWCVEINAGQVPMAGGYQRLASLIGPRSQVTRSLEETLFRGVGPARWVCPERSCQHHRSCSNECRASYGSGRYRYCTGALSSEASRVKASNALMSWTFAAKIDKLPRHADGLSK